MVLALLYAVVGIIHLSRPDMLLSIMPDWVPWPRLVILATGVCEILGALALLTRSLRRAAGMALALYAICVFPANINQALRHIPLGGIQPGWWYNGPRLALQPLLVWWALFAGDWITWPFRRVSAANYRKL